jgi:hypothetical protein
MRIQPHAAQLSRFDGRTSSLPRYVVDEILQKAGGGHDLVRLAPLKSAAGSCSKPAARPSGPATKGNAA